MANRSAPALLGCFGALLGCAPEELLVSQDRWCLYRPTTDARGEEAHPEWRTDTKLHLDMHPWQYRASGSGAEALRYESRRDWSKEVSFVDADSGPHLQAPPLPPPAILTFIPSQYLCLSPSSSPYA